jgi:23S rRNA pseudouridine2605 synthase
MPRSNSSGPSRRRSDSKGKSFGKSGGESKGKSFKKSTGKSFSSDPGDKPFRKSFGKSSAGGERPFKKSSGKFSGDSGEKPFRKSSTGGTERPFKKSFSKSFSGDSKGKPFKKSYGASGPSDNKRSGTGKPSRSRFSDKDESSSERKSFTPKKYSRPTSNDDKPLRRKRIGDDKKEDFRSDESGNRKDSQRSNPNYGRPFKRKTSERFDKKSDGDETPRPRRSDDASEKRGFFNKEVRKGKGPRKSFSDTTEEAPLQDKKIRLNKFIANSGVCSRREADELITMGLISVNGKTITELGYKVNPGDEVRHENKILRAEKPVYILMNKPKGFLTTTTDPQERNTVMHIIGGAVKERIYPVGRLDRNTTGLLLFTNDGDLAEKLMHPSYNVKKIYKVELDRPLTRPDFEKIAEGVHLEEGKAVVDDMAIISDDGKTVGLEIHIGWNRVVRRIFEALEYAVVKLDRSVYAGLDKKDLPRGHWRFLTQEEIVRLKHYK